jgi:hypothetical protein
MLDKQRSTAPYRALAIGLGLVLFISIGAPYSIWIVGSSEITWSVFPIGVGVPFVLLVLVNALLKRLCPSRALAPFELIIIVVMGLVCSGSPIFVAGYILAVISKPYYGASPENEWAAFVQPYLPDWAIPHDRADAMRHFYEGLPAGQSIPFDAWLGPLFWWLTLVLAIYTCCLCLTVLLRRQWVEYERLAFPIAEVPQLLVKERTGAALPPLFYSPAFWCGCAVPLGIILFNMISYFQPGFPQLAVHRGDGVQLFDGVAPLLLLIYFPVIGFTYLVSTSISFSIWFFYLFSLLQSRLANWADLSLEHPDAFVWDWQPLSWQAYGAFCAMVLWSLWMARKHLRDALRQALGRASAKDEDEMLSYRAAFIGGSVAGLYVLAWLWRSGMDLHIALLYFASMLAIFVGITRLAVQAGLHYLTAPLVAQALPFAITGTAIAPHNIVAMGLSYGTFGDVESIFMPSAAHAARLGETSRHPRQLTIAIALAVIGGIVATWAFMLYMCYEYGGGNFRSWFFQPGAGAGGIAFDTAVRQLRNPWPTDWGKLAYFASGAGLYSALSVFHYRFYWWPLHPIGLTIATTWMVRRIALSIFIAWALKSIILRLGGVTLYHRLRPFFIGLVVGFFLGVGTSYLVDIIWFFGKGHPILHG